LNRRIFFFYCDLIEAAALNHHPFVAFRTSTFFPPLLHTFRFAVPARFRIRLFVL